MVNDWEDRRSSQVGTTLPKKKKKKKAKKKLGRDKQAGSRGNGTSATDSNLINPLSSSRSKKLTDSSKSKSSSWRPGEGSFLQNDSHYAGSTYENRTSHSTEPHSRFTLPVNRAADPPTKHEPKESVLHWLAIVCPDASDPCSNVGGSPSSR
eukprot:gene6434-9848_t